MAPHDTDAILQLAEEIRGIRSDLRVIHTKLFGEDAAESPQGRIPRLESAVIDHGHRIKHLERRRWMQQGASMLLGAIVTAAGFLYYLKGLAK